VTPALPTASAPKIRRLLIGVALLVATVGVLTSATSTFAAAGAAPAPAPVQSVRAQRPLADDFLIDQQIAAVGPAMRPLVAQFNAIWPTHGEITTYFGEVGPYSPRGHSGLDVAAPEGTPVVAIDDGEVLKAYWNGDGYGGLVIIGHPSGYETWYGHLERFDVEHGEQVRRGQRIALMGSTGFSTGPHLHFEVRQDGQLVDPLEFLQERSLIPADE
jgi:murein DD-endopeptidase MepM/ murein hydrolase activator NlpD